MEIFVTDFSAPIGANVFKFCVHLQVGRVYYVNENKDANPYFVFLFQIFIFIPPANFVCVGYTVFTLSLRACVRACVHPSDRTSVAFCFFNILKSYCWIFIKPCKHVHICKTNTLDKKVRARGQFY